MLYTLHIYKICIKNIKYVIKNNGRTDLYTTIMEYILHIYIKLPLKAAVCSSPIPTHFLSPSSLRISS